jgi:2,3-bisphosphoglycerate-dependent phosphoglycerate mutase
MSTQREYRQVRFQRAAGACEIILVRHGESAAARDGESFPMIDGQADPPLHPEGERQALLVRDRLVASGERLAAVYVTSLQRTVQTAQPLLEALGMEPIIEPDLREVYLGEFEGGELRKRAAAGDPLLLQAWAEQSWDPIPGAEPDEEFTTRVKSAVERIASMHPDETVAVFVHGGVIGKIMALATGARGLAFAATDNAAISHIVVTGDHWTVRAWNDTAHLGPRFTRDPEPLV